MQTQLPLNILSAFYAKADVTAKVRSFVNQSTLSVKADNGTFGDPWPGMAKALVIVYQYTYYRPEVIIVKEGETVNINPQNYKYQTWLLPPQGTLAILGAAYGLSNITDLIATRVHGNSLNIVVDNNNLGDGWSGVKKLLTVTYLSNFGTPVTVTAEEGTQLAINNEQSTAGHSQAQKAHLHILGAAYGKQNITDKVRSFINQDSLTIKADNAIFGDPWPGQAKSFAIIYQYGLFKPEVAVTHEGGTISINPQAYKYQQWFPPGQGQFAVLGATYGLTNVTDAVNSKCKGQFLDLTIDNNNLGDGWSGVKKSFVAVAVNNKGVPVTVIREEGEHLKLDQNAGY